MRSWLSKITLVSILTAAFSVLNIASASTPTPDDFAYVAKLSNAKTSLRELQLPTDLYDKLYRHDYGDLRIFSAEGQIVPHQLSRADTKGTTQISNLIFYPFSREQASKEGNINIEINQNTGKKQIKINQSLNTNKISANKLSNGDENSIEYQYIIENSHFLSVENKNQYSSLCKLKLYWKQNKPSLILGLKLESSQNLQQWRSLSRQLNVSRLNYADSQLVRDEVEFACTSEPYLRLTWLNQDEYTDNGVRLTSIQGFFTQRDALKSQWKTFSKPSYNDDGHWLFESNVVAPLVKMEFNAPSNGMLYKGKLFSRHKAEEDWRYRNQITQYRLNLGDSELKSNSFSLGAINDRYWKFEPSTETQFTDSQLPEIRAGWRSNKVLFIAQGSEPFQLAFGNPNILPAKNSDLNKLINSLQQSSSSIDSVSLKEIVDQDKGFSRDGKTNWKKIALWFVLLLGTALMGFMASRLFRQMSDESKVPKK